MIMAGYEFMNGLPFQNVYFTGIIRDKQGRKMSKSLGNSPDPLDLIGKYGADALRFGTMRSAPLGQDILFDEQNVELGRNFCNKLWNACRFRQMVGSGGSASGEVQGEIDPKTAHGRRQMDFAQARRRHPRNEHRVRRIQIQRRDGNALPLSSGANIATGTSRRARPPCPVAAEVTRLHLENPKSKIRNPKLVRASSRRLLRRNAKPTPSP